MGYGFYADVFFLTNFYLDFLAVYAVGELLQQKRRIRRYLAASAAGSFLGCILFLQLRNYDLYLLCIHFMVNPGMTFLCFFPEEKRLYGKAFCLTYFILLLMGGSMQWMYLTVCGGHYYEICLLLTAFPVVIFLYILRRKRKDVNCFYRVEIVSNGKEVSVRALFDTGNRLTDPYVGEPVHIISSKLFDKLRGEAECPVRFVPFSSVGCGQGMLRAFTAEIIRVDTGRESVEVTRPVLAAADEEIFKGRTYQMILNSSLGEKIERREEKKCT